MDYQSRYPIYLFTDTSKVGAGAWIGQGPSLEKAQPAAFYSQKFATSQLHYPVHELELLAKECSPVISPHALWYQVHCGNGQQSAFILPIPNNSP